MVTRFESFAHPVSSITTGCKSRTCSLRCSLAALLLPEFPKGSKDGRDKRAYALTCVLELLMRVAFELCILEKTPIQSSLKTLQDFKE